MKDDAEAVGADRSGEGQPATGSGGHEGQPASGEGQPPAPEVAAQPAAVQPAAAAATAPAAAAPAAATAATAPAAPGLANQKDSDLAPGTLVTTRATKERAKWDNQSAKIIGALANVYKVQLLSGPGKGTIKKYAKRCIFVPERPRRTLVFARADGSAIAGGGDAPAGGGGAFSSGGGAVSSGGGDASPASERGEGADDDDGFAAFS